MYIHLGAETVVRQSDVIGVFDIETCTIGKHTRQFLANATKNGQIVNVSMELPKSFIVAGKKTDSKVYISQISSATLKKRSEHFDDILNS
ncbi:MAG: DUF370 domain-containing protein [Clostridia bacterium]|nr:DUF370 domain-containing protein [Clostridia bacterium]